MVDFVDTIVDNVGDHFTLCKATTKKGKPCTNRAQPNGYCGVPRHRELAESQQEDPAIATKSPTPGQEVADQHQSSVILEPLQEDLATMTTSLPIRQHSLDTTHHDLDRGGQRLTDNESVATPFSTANNTQSSIQNINSLVTSLSIPDNGSFSADKRKDSLGNLPRTPAKSMGEVKAGGHIKSTPLNGSRGSENSFLAKKRRDPMALDIVKYSYQSTSVIDSFLKDVPVIKDDVINCLCKEEAWRKFRNSCTSSEDKGNGKGRSQNNSSNEYEFKSLVKCIAGLKDIEGYFKGQRTEKESGSNSNKCERGPRRISHQGTIPMDTLNREATWLKGGPTTRSQELKPDFMTLQVQTIQTENPRERCVRPILPQTILPPPIKWEPKLMKDTSFPIVMCKDPVWESLEVFWECKRSEDFIDDAEAIIDCTMKATETLRYQWSRRFVYCFLHCGTKMRLLQFDRSGLLASEAIDVVDQPRTFVRCLIGAFCHDASRLGFPIGPSPPRHEMVKKILRQVVTVGDKELYLIKQVAGPTRDHLVSRATTTFRARLKPKDKEVDIEYCFKSSWPQKVRRHEGEYLEILQGTPNVVSLLAYDVPKVELSKDYILYDTTKQGRGDSGEQTPMIKIQNFVRKIDVQPGFESTPTFDEREHRQTVCKWVEHSLDNAVSNLTEQQDISNLTKLQGISSLWQGAFLAIDGIVKKGILHRDISFQNVRVDKQNKVHVCDFDMATEVNSQPSGANERTGTPEFMATSVLQGIAKCHSSVHDCESVFWICALSLLKSTSVGYLDHSVRNVFSLSSELMDVASAKIGIIDTLRQAERGSDMHSEPIRVDAETTKSMYYCLADLSRILDKTKFSRGYDRAEEFQKSCFTTLARAIEGAFAPDEDKV